MKVFFQSGNRRRHPAVAGGVVLAASLLGAAPGMAQGTSTNASDFETSPTDYNNWLTLGAGGAFINDGDKAQFEHETHLNNGPFGGIQDFHLQEFVGQQGLFTLDGHAMPGNGDYSVNLKLSDPDKGYISGGFNQFRTWYDGNGGFFPQNGQWFSPLDDELHIDRGSLWFEGGLTLPDKPSLVVRYEHDYRQGQMDSTSWGDTALTGGYGTRNIVPTFQDIDETRDIFTADVKDKLGSTDAGLGARYEVDRSYDSLNIDRMPDSSANRYVTQDNGERDDLFSVHGFTETVFNKQATFSLGGDFTEIDTHISGSRIYGPSYGAPFSTTYADSQNHDEGFTGLSGGGTTKDYVANMNWMLTPHDNLVFVPAFRVEYQDSDLSDNFSDNAVTSTGGPVNSTPSAFGADNWYLDVAESLEARYTGFRNWSLYADGEWSEDNGNEMWNETTGIITPVLNQDWNRLGQKYTIGANWYPLYRLNFGAQYYHQIHDYDYDNNLTPAPTAYPGYLQNENFVVDDMNIRITWRILDTLSSVTRYDFQYSTVDTTGIPNGGTTAATIQSASLTSHIISENISWTPTSRLYVQAGGSYVLNSLGTPAQDWMGTNQIVLDSADNYWTVDATAGYALGQHTDLQVQYTYYRADDYANNSASSQPFGAGDEQDAVTATLTHQFTKALQVGLKYGFFTNRDATSGGHDNYDAQLVYADMQYRF